MCDPEFSFFSSEDEFMRAAAITPRSNCVMNSDKLRRAGIRLTEVHEAIERDLRNWRKAGLADSFSSEARDQHLNLRSPMQLGEGNVERSEICRLLTLFCGRPKTSWEGAERCCEKWCQKTCSGIHGRWVGLRLCTAPVA